jgi:hypothetical protein
MKQTTMKSWKKNNCLKDNEQDCMLEIRCFYRAGDYAMVLLPKVLPNIFQHWKIAESSRQEKILDLARTNI